ncbi:MAG: thioredoxin [Clostridium sp.]|nr:thioredoxin [Clostridium sp.]
MSEIKLTGTNFEKEVLNSDIPVLVDFYADWCGPCKMLSPILSEIADENDGIIKVGKVNTDNEQELAVKFGITSIPALFVFKEGKVVNTSVGYTSKKNILNMLG